MKYYYNKFNSVEESDTYSNPTGYFASDPGVDISMSTVNYYAVPGYSFSAENGFEPAGALTQPSGFVLGFTYWKSSSTNVTRYILNSIGATTFNADLGYKSCTRTIIYAKSTLVASGLTAENGTYPDNDRHTDGFWYVRGNPASSMMFMNF